MDQAQSFIPGIVLTCSGKQSRIQAFIVTLFLDNISKRVFTEFQHSTGGEETLRLKKDLT